MTDIVDPVQQRPMAPAETAPAATAHPNPPMPATPPAQAVAPPVPVLTAGDPRRKSPLLAMLLSLLPGLGQVYVGYYRRGFAHALIVAVLLTVTSIEIEAVMPFLAISLAFCNVASGVLGLSSIRKSG